MFSKFKIEKAPYVLYKRGPRRFEVEQSAISLPLLGSKTVKTLKREKVRKSNLLFYPSMAARLSFFLHLSGLPAY